MPRKSATKEPLCNVSDNIGIFETVKEIRENVCVKESEYPLTEHTDGKRYCLFHLPTKDKDKNKFEQIFDARIKAVESKIAEIEKLPEAERKAAKAKVNYDFRYVWFPNKVILIDYKFSATAYFDSTTFSDWAIFRSLTFSNRAIFRSATFSSVAEFGLITFSDDADFDVATFDEKSYILFYESKFSGILSFNGAKVKGYVTFEGNQDERLFEGGNARLELNSTQIEDARKILFQGVRLEPNWFVDTNATAAAEFVFTDCRWQYANGKPLNVKTELKILRKRFVVIDNPNARLTRACRQLADNYEESKGFEEASMFRRIAMESKRKENLWGFKIWSLHWWYWLSSLYGESWKRAFGVLLGILFIFTIYYHFAFFQICPKNSDDETICQVRTMQIDEAAHQSLYTAALQNIEYRKTLTLGQDIVILFEKILAPLQAALLALAIRRKFMR